ncbi:MAG: YqaA family protein [Pseudomonadota bacterium]
MLRKLYDRTMALAGSRHAEPALFGVSFTESSFFPIPPDLLLIPMVLSNRARWIWYATLCTVASVLGGLAGYAIGLWLFNDVALPILEVYGYADKIEAFTESFNAWGWLIVFFAGITPFPYKVITITAGATGLSIPIFIVASLVSRGLRFFIVAALLYWLGPPIRAFIEERLGLMLTIVVVLGIAGFFAIRLIR